MSDYKGFLRWFKEGELAEEAKRQPEQVSLAGKFSLRAIDAHPFGADGIR